MRIELTGYVKYDHRCSVPGDLIDVTEGEGKRLIGLGAAKAAPEPEPAKEPDPPPAPAPVAEPVPEPEPKPVTKPAKKTTKPKARK